MLKKIRTIIACVLMVTIISTMGLAGLTATAAESAAAPEVLSVTPSGEELTRVFAGSVTFDSVMDRSTLTGENIKVTDVTNGDAIIVEQKATSAYDNEYVFLCEFEPNTTYKITVGTNVKNSEGTALLEEYVHTFTTGDKIESVAYANPAEAENYTHNSEGRCDGKLSYIYDGKLDKMYYTYSNDGPASRYVAIDLGKKSEISHIYYVPKLNTADWGNSWTSNIKIQAANEDDFSDAVDLAVTPVITDQETHEGLYEWIAVNKDNKLYRYIRIIKDSVRIAAVELGVYNYPSTEIVEAEPVNIGLKKEISYNEALGIYESGNISSINDGIKDSSDYVAFNPSDESGKRAFFRFDLLKPYPISKINFYTGDGSKNDTKNMTVYGSNELCPVEEMDVLYESQDGFEPGKKNTIRLDGESAYRYITFQKSADGIFSVSEVEILSYTDINFNNDWKIANQKSSYRIKLDDVESYEEGKELLMLALGYGKDGYLTSIDTINYVLSEGTNNIDIKNDKAAGTDKVYVTSIDSFDSLKVNFRPTTTPSRVFKTKRTSLSLKGEETAIFLILKSGKSFEGEVTKADILYADIEIADENGKAEFAYDFKETDETGVFEAGIYITHADGTVSFQSHKLYNYSQESFDLMVEDFDEAVTNAEFASVLKKYTETMPYFTLDAIPEMKNAEVSGAVGEDFAKIKDLYLEESGNTAENMTEALKTAYLLYSARTQSDDKVLEKYGEMVKGYNPKKYDDSKVLIMLLRLYENITNGKSFEKVCEDACIYSLMLNADADEMAEIINTYSEYLGIDVSYAEDKNIAITDVIKKLDRENPEQYVGILGETFVELVDEISQQRGKTEQNRVERGTGAGRGGAGGGTAFFPKETNEQTEVSPETASPESSKEFTFADTVNFKWANEAIGDLAEKGIISGVDGINFMPDRAITREEFAKIIYLSFKPERKDGKVSAFEDCLKEAWYYPYTDALFASGIIKGVSETEFGVGTYITRQDAAVILERVASVYGKNMTKGEMTFLDAEKVSVYAQNAVSKLSKSGIITGFADNTFKPASNITRAQAAVMIYRMMQYIGA